MANAFMALQPGAVGGGKRDKLTAYQDLAVPNFILPGGSLRVLTDAQANTQRIQRQQQSVAAQASGFFNDFLSIVPGIAAPISQLIDSIPRLQGTDKGILNVPQRVMRTLFRAKTNNPASIQDYRRYHAARALKYFQQMISSFSAATIDPELFTQRVNRRGTDLYKAQSQVTQAKSRAKRIIKSNHPVDVGIRTAVDAPSAFRSVSSRYDNDIFDFASNPNKGTFLNLLQTAGGMRSVANMGEQYETLQAAMVLTDQNRQAKGKALLYAGPNVFYTGLFGKPLTQKLLAFGVPPMVAEAAINNAQLQGIQDEFQEAINNSFRAQEVKDIVSEVLQSTAPTTTEFFQAPVSMGTRGRTQAAKDIQQDVQQNLRSASSVSRSKAQKKIISKPQTKQTKPYQPQTQPPQPPILTQTGEIPKSRWKN